MKTRFSNQRNQALTITEVLVTVAMVCVLAAVALADAYESQTEDQSKACVNNLKQIGLAYRIWEGDNNDKFPQRVSAKKGGAMESAENGIAYVCFQVMSNELSTPKILVCSADTNRFAAADFKTGFDNSHVSYFVGVDADDADPQGLLSGDSNVAADGKPVKSGLLRIGKNVPVTWTSERHVNQGNIGFADGSVRQGTDDKMLEKLEGRLAIP